MNSEHKASPLSAGERSNGQYAGLHVVCARLRFTVSMRQKHREDTYTYSNQTVFAVNHGGKSVLGVAKSIS
jgi:hypothetical protein